MTRLTCAQVADSCAQAALCKSGASPALHVQLLLSISSRILLLAGHVAQQHQPAHCRPRRQQQDACLSGAPRATAILLILLKRSIDLHPESDIHHCLQAMLHSSTSLLIADHAGSGKTLAYLAPLVQRLRAHEASAADVEPEFKNAPRALILTPTTELCQQVMAVAKGLAREAPFRSCAITGVLLDESCWPALLQEG